MAVQDDLAQVVTSRDSDAAIINFWSAAEYAYRTLCEGLDKMNEAKAKVDMDTCPDSIKVNGGGVLQKMQQLRDLLEANHLGFLTWVPPQG